MSQENVDAVRRSYEILNSGDFEAWLAADAGRRTG